MFFNNISICNITKSLTGTVFNLSTFHLPTLDFELYKLVEITYNLSISNLSTSDFKLAKSTFLASGFQHDVSTPVAFLHQVLLRYQKDLLQLFISICELYDLEKFRLVFVIYLRLIYSTFPLNIHLLLLFSLLQFLFIKSTNIFFIIKIFNNMYPWNYIFNLF